MSLYKTKVALSIQGDRIERGTEIELSDETVSHLDPADIELLGASVEAEAEDEPEVSLDDMSQAQLKARAAELELSTAGSKADLKERITLHLAGTEDEPEEEEIIND